MGTHYDRGVDSTPQLPEPFRALADLAAGPVTIDHAKALTDALLAIPDLQRWLRAQRQQTVRSLLDEGRTRDEIAPHLQVTPQRVADIAAGHRSTSAPRQN